MANNNLEVKLISECFVRPKYDVKDSEKPYHLIGMDLKLLPLGYIQNSFAYHKPTTKEFNINSFVEMMIDSLVHTLVHYYPLAGRLTTVKYEDEHACSIHVDCNKGPGARFIHASCEHVSLSDLVNRLPKVPFLFDLGEPRAINYDGHTQALVSIQVTEFKDGIVIAFTMNHSLGDACSLMNFVSSLSEIFRAENDNKKDTLLISHSSMFTPFLPDGCKLLQKLPYLEPDEFINRANTTHEPLEEKIFRFSISSISKLKERANSELGLAGIGKISSFQAFAALVWISINRARKTPVEEMTFCLIPIDCRARLRPPLSPNHFSNQAQVRLMSKNTGELLEDGLGSAALVLHKGINSHNHHVATRRHKALMENPQVLMESQQVQLLNNVTINERKSMNTVSFSWGPKFDVYGVDFGLGKVVASPNEIIDDVEGAVSVKQGAEGIGSTDLTLALLRDNMLALESDKDFMAYVS